MSDIVWVFALSALPLILLAMTNWRYAFLAALVAGFAQDPIRKVLAEQPVQMVIFGVFALCFALAGAMARVGGVTLRPMTGGNARTRTTLRLFLLYVLLQAGVSLFKFSSVMVPAIGILAYVTPIPALWLAYNYMRESNDIRRFIRVYVVLGMVATSGIYFSNAGFDWPLLQQIGGDRLIFDRVAGIVEAHSGFMRSPEISAWHAAAVACMSIVAAVAFGGALTRLATPAVVIFCVYASILTGRRKVLAVTVLFIAIYGVGLYYFQRRTRRRGVVIAALLAVLLLFGALALAPEVGSLSPYMARSTTVFADAWDRLTNLGFASVGWGLDAGGFFGMGTGAGAQGTQSFSEGAALSVGGAAEGGLGKITAELGIPGLLLAIGSAWLVARQVKRSIAAAAAADKTLMRLCLGLLAFVAANVPVFIGASQVYGDPFVLILLGSMLGFVLAAPRVAMLQQAKAAIRQLTEASVETAVGVAIPHKPRAPGKELPRISWGDEETRE